MSARKINGEISDIACSSPGNCGAVGSGFVVRQSQGNWGPVTQIARPAGTTSVSVGAISCPANGSCVTEGTFSSSTGFTPFVLVEVNGHWAEPGAVNVAFNAADATLYAGSCASPGNCVVGGDYLLPGFGGMDWSAFVVEETNGLWGVGHQVASRLPGDASVNGISCTAPGDCSAAGEVGSKGFVIDETNGHWGLGQKVPGTLSSAYIRAGGAGPISCTSPGNCAVAGGWEGTNGWIAFVATEISGHWQAAKLIGPPGGDDDEVNAVSCVSAGHCVAVGDGKVSGIVLIEANGNWGNPASLPGTAQGSDLSAVSCVKAGRCVIGGQFDKKGTTYAFVATN